MGNWKNDRAEGEMREAGKKRMKKAADEAEMKENQEWEDLKNDLYLVGDNDLVKTTNYHIGLTIDHLRREGYELPTKK